MENRQSSERELLHVVKASAGSGKTHRLTGEYLRLLFSTPNNHRHILAVTFTNKATKEMKSRIVEELHRLSSGADSAYLMGLTEYFSMSREAVRTKAKTVLKTILHDYSAFSVSTIDRFFQQTMRSFARETGLAGGYNIELNENSLLTETIDLMLSELDKPKNKTLSEWLLRFMQHNIEEGKNWNIDGQIQSMAKQLFNETYKSFTDEEQSAIRDKKQLETYKQMLIRIVQTYEDEMKSTGEKAKRIMEEYGLSPDDFRYKRNSGFLIFSKLAGGIMEKPSPRLVALADNVDLWYTNGTKKQSAIRSACTNGLNDCVKQIIRLSDNDREYQTAKHLLGDFYTLGILNDIKQRLHKLQQENNTLFLSDTTELLNDIIAGTDAPFIYEKTGIRILHYMIDEFQDTSRMQWENFRPLIGESLASGNLNLIVGDTKQSIYRFRNSDWRLLEEQVKEDFQARNIREHVLDTNWRSDAHIVQFNNAFFTKAAITLQNDFNASIKEMRHTEEAQNNYRNQDSQIANAYADLYQQVPPKKANSGGQVKIVFLKNDKEKDWKADVLKQLPHEIEALQDQGFALKDIAIVVRSNPEATLVAETLLAYQKQHPATPYRFDIISNEALLIGNAQCIKTIIALMQYFRNPNDDTRRMMAIYEFYRFQRRSSPNETLRIYREEANGDFPDEFKNHLQELASMPFYEMTEYFFSIMADSLDAGENAYVQAFIDIVLKFKDNATADLNYFLDWWDEARHKKALFSPEDQDAIRLITIHKSKGLSFGAVIMPFVNWKMDHDAKHKNIIWCKPGSAPFNALSVTPLKYCKGLENTIFRDSYTEEKRFTYIDNLNLLYVAFTRPKHRLIAFAPMAKELQATSKESKTTSSVSDLLWKSICDETPPLNEKTTASIPANPAPNAPQPFDSDRSYIPLNEYLRKEEAESVFEYGTPNTVRKHEEKPTTAIYKTNKWQSIPFGDRLRLRLNAIDYFDNNGRRNYGLMMHDIVSNVKTLSDIPQAVEQKISEGELKEEERHNTICRLTDVLSHPDISSWYSDRYTVLNETLLLHPNSGLSRPDRVMIGSGEVIVVDYKFGEVEESKYIRQVRHYAQHIREMGYQNVKGFLFYVNLKKIVQA